MKDKFNFTYFASEIMASYFLFVTYTIVLSWWINQSKWVRSTGLPIRLLVSFFILKIIVGCLYGYWYSHQEHADTWSFHAAGIAEHELLFSDPWQYLTNLFHTDYPGGWKNIFSNQNSDWNDLKDHIMAKIISVMHIFSFANYYVNVVLYSFITFFGYIFLYKALKGFYGNLSKVATFFLFLTPSCLFWTSGIHKDGLVLLLISVMFYQLYQIVQPGGLRFKISMLLLLTIALVLTFRSYVVAAILPPSLALIFCHSRRASPAPVFLVMYTVLITFFFLSKSLPGKVVNYRMDFQKMTGSSRLEQKSLEPEFGSFITNLPEALDHALLRPFVWEAKGLTELFAGFEVLVFFVMILLALIFHRTVSPRPIDWLMVGFSFSLLIFVGYVVAFAGAIVRYRAIYYMMILVVSGQYFDERKFLSLFKSRKS